MTVSEAWTCPTCNRIVGTPYCSECGERHLDARHLTLGGRFHQFVHAFTSVDGRLIRSFRCLVNRPGALTVTYVRGQRTPYIGPFRLFLIANVLFFATQSLTHTDIVSVTLDSHLHNQDWSALAQRLVSHRLDTMRTTPDLYAPIFDQAVVLNAKSLITLYGT